MLPEDGRRVVFKRVRWAGFAAYEARETVRALSDGVAAGASPVADETCDAFDGVWREGDSRRPRVCECRDETGLFPQRM